MALIILLLVNLVLVQGRTEVETKLAFPLKNHTHLDVYANALGKAHYNAWTCNYRYEPGYKCLSCSAALHCYPGNFALLVQCAGIFPHCRNGYCSRWKTEDCNEDYMFAEGTHGPLRVTTTTESNEKTTISSEENFVTGTEEPLLGETTTSTATTTEVHDSNKVEEIVTSAYDSEKESR